MRLVDEIRCLPCAFIVKEPVRPLLVVFCDCFWFFVALEPCLILLVKSPALRLECLRCQVLLVRALAVIEDEEKGVDIYPCVQSRIIEYW